jgi:hypothetical protein
MAGCRLIAITLLSLVPVSATLARQEVVQLSPDTFVAICDSKAGMFASMGTLKAKTIALANDYASKQGKVAIAISTNERPPIPFKNSFPRVEYQFRLVDADDPAAKSTALVSVRNGISEAVDPIQSPATTPSHEDPNSGQRDIYTELLKLDELRQKGIITQDEFDAQKKKILTASK